MNRINWKAGAALFGLLVAGMLVAAGPLLLAEDKKADADADRPFGSKVLVVYLKSQHSAEHPFVLEGVSLTEVRGRQYLVGKCSADWAAGSKATLALDDVSALVEFDDLATYGRRVKAANTSAAGNK